MPKMLSRSRSLSRGLPDCRWSAVNTHPIPHPRLPSVNREKVSNLAADEVFATHGAIDSAASTSPLTLSIHAYSRRRPPMDGELLLPRNGHGDDIESIDSREVIGIARVDG